MGFVLDASVVLTWAFPDEDDASTLAIMRRLRTETARVATVWWFEVRNVLLVNERRQRMTADDAAAFLRALSGFPIEIAAIPDSGRIMAPGRRHRLAVYDCAYLELVLRDGPLLATLDAPLAGAARHKKIPVVRPLAAASGRNRLR